MAHTHKLVDGVKVDLTAEEIAKLNAKDEIENKKIADAKTIYDNNKYQRDREAEYLSTLGNWQDQLENQHKRRSYQCDIYISTNGRQMLLKQVSLLCLPLISWCF